VSKKAKNPEAAIKMLNLALENMYGENADPDKYNSTKDGHGVFEYALLYGEAPLKNLTAHKKVVAALNSGDTSSLNEEEKGYFDSVTASQGGDINFWATDRMYGPGGSLGVLNQYVDEDHIMNNAFFGAPTQTMVDKEGSLQKLQLESFTSIIMGESIDKFDDFVESWKKLGGEQMTKEVNEWYKAQ